MARGRQGSLNESGEMLMTRIVRGAALHVSRAEQTLRHSHYAWKVHIGLDAPVWFESTAVTVSQAERVNVVIVPPGLEHRIGSLGLSLTLLVAPGTHSTPWRSDAAAAVAQGATAQRIIDVCTTWRSETREDTAALVAELLRQTFGATGTASSVDVRTRRALARLSQAPDTPLEQLAQREHVSVDRLSHVVVQDTGVALRRHKLWSRITRLLSANKQFPSFAAAAAHGGFSDHAHLTRVYRAMVGRLPSDFTGPPDAIEPWACY
jgi:AraC-like DNA-binding protein